jgi:excisionase family DNA binding protein
MQETLNDNNWLAKKLNVSKQTARTLHLKTDLPCLRIGRLIRYRESDVDMWLNNQMKGAVCGK